MLRFKKSDGSEYPPVETKKIGELYSPIKGAPLSKADITDDGTPLLLYGELYTRYGEVAHNIFRRTDKTVDEKYYSVGNDVVIPTSGETPEDISTATCVVPAGVILGGDLNIYRSDEVNGKFFSYTVNHAKKYDIAKIAQGASIIHIKAEDVAQITIDVPCKEEQECIVDCLESIDAVIADYEAQVENMQSQKKGVMQKLFSQEVRFKADDGSGYPALKETLLPTIAKIKMGQSPDSNSYNDNQEGLPLIQGNADINDHKTCPTRYTNKPTKVCETGDIIMTVRAPVGYVAYAQEVACIGRGVCSITPNDSVCKEYVYYYLMHFEHSWKKIEQGSTFTAISGKDLEAFSVIVPCLEEQQKIADCLSSFDTAIDDLQKTVERWKNIKKGLLQQLFA